ncbi:MAG TPA: GreA/GreB family elongation factor [Alphaproteobacteria bacterium]|nr:GreA/GreB family elongation factor [Alphaproteobacteria bacterium]
MSRAFVKETDGEDLYDSLPDRPIDPRPNLVTAEGLAQIEEAIARLLAARGEAESKNDRAALAESARDLRYWQARRASAELMPTPDSDAQTRFGHRITLRRDVGGLVVWHIVGIDEADPAQGRLSYVAPLAQALLGKRVGDEVDLGKQGMAEIVAISAL